MRETTSSTRRVPLGRAATALAAAALLAASCSSDPSGPPSPAGSSGSGADSSGAAAASGGDGDASEGDGEFVWAAPTGAEAGLGPIRAVDCPDHLSDRGVACALATVPVDRNEPGLGTAEISVVTWPGSDDGSDGDGAGAAPMAVLQGGPGGASSEMALFYPRRPFTQVFIDQRGTGFGSADFNCREYDEVLEELLAATSDEALEIGLRAYGRCRERLSGDPLLDHTDTAAHAADVVDVMAALGHDRWLVYGVSYGTTIALEVLREAPEGLVGAVLDGVFPADIDLNASVPYSARRALDEINRACSADAGCSAMAGDLTAATADLIRRLDDKPLVVSLAGFESATGSPVDVLIDGQALAGMVFQLLYLDWVIPVIPSALAWLAEDDEAAARWLAELGVRLSAILVSTSSEGTYFSTTCADFLPQATEPPEDAGAFALAVAGERLDEACALWDVPASPPPAAPVASDLPVVLLSGRFDPITPPEFAEQAAEHLPNAVVVVLDGRSHGVWGADECAGGIVDEFASDPRTAPDISCADEAAPMDWVQR